MMTFLLGWVASAFVLLGMTMKTMPRLRGINSIACILWMGYGIVIHDAPVLFVNMALLLTHVHWAYTSGEMKTWYR
jgi:hypothetical protein